MPDFLFLFLFVALDPKRGRTQEDRNDGWANYTRERKKAKHVYVRRETVLWGTRASKQEKEKKWGHGEKKVMAKSHITRIYLWKRICRMYSTLK